MRKAVKTVRGYEAQREFYLKVAMPVLLSVMFANSLFQINRTWKIVSIHGHNFLHPNLSLRSKILSRYFFFTWGNPAKLRPTFRRSPFLNGTNCSWQKPAHDENIWPYCCFLSHTVVCIALGWYIWTQNIDQLSVGRALHQYHRGHGFKSSTSLKFFSGPIFNYSFQ